MAVDIHSGDYRGVAELGLDELRMLSLSDQKGSAGVPEIMKSDSAQSRPCQSREELLLNHVSRLQGASFPSAEHEVMRANRAGHFVDF